MKKRDLLFATALLVSCAINAIGGYALPAKAAGASYSTYTLKKDIILPDETMKTSNKTDGTGNGGIIFHNGKEYKVETRLGTEFNSNKAASGAAISTMYTTDISDTKFYNNTATMNGGAINSLMKADYIFSLKGSEFSKNTAKNGGALYTKNIGTTTIESNIFTENSSSAYGGAIYNATYELKLIGKNIFDKNGRIEKDGKIIETQYGGAIYNYLKGTLITEGSVFTNNYAKYAGGAIYSTQGAVSSIGNTYTNNSAGSNGGAIQVIGAVLNIDGDTFNACNTVQGGAIVVGGNNIESTINNAIFTGNFAETAGAIWVQPDNYTLKISNTTFDTNYATGSAGGGAIVIAKDSTCATVIIINNSEFKGNYAEQTQGGAIANFGKLVIEDTKFIDNKTKTAGTNAGGGALMLGSNSETTLTNVTFKDNISAGMGGAIGTRFGNVDNSAAKLDIYNSTFDHNIALENGGAIDNHFLGSKGKGGSINIVNTVFENNIATKDGGAIYTDTALEIADGDFINNTAGNKGGAIYTNSDLAISAVSKDVVMSGNKADNGNDIYMNNENTNLYMNAKNNQSITIASGVSGDKYNMILNTGDNTGSIIVTAPIKNAAIEVQNGMLHLAQGSELSFSTLNMKSGSTLNTVDNKITSFDGTTFAEDVKLIIDANLSNGKTDSFKNATVQGKVTVVDINKIGNVGFNGTSINLAKSLGISSENLIISESLQKERQRVLTPIRYLEGGVNKDGMLVMAPTGNKYKDFNPSIMAAPVAAQLGGYLTQLNSYDEAFRNMDMYMLMPKSQRVALKYGNKYAASDGNLVFDLSTKRTTVQLDGWVRPYTTYEKVGLRNGPKVSNMAYGSFFGADSKLHNLGRGWDGSVGVYIGYNGSHQSYDGISMYQNGGTVGLIGTAYKGNFFTGLTVNTGVNIGEASTTYGNDNFAMWMFGIANKTGYNIEFADGKFVVQPSIQLSYSFVDTFDYINASGVKINSDLLNAFQIEPGLKFIGNLKKGYQPYIGVSFVWNIVDKTKFQANDVSLPELSIKPYVRYGIGLRKIWGECCTGFLQVYLTNGGRNGIGVQAGFRYTFGKSFD